MLIPWRSCIAATHRGIRHHWCQPSPVDGSRSSQDSPQAAQRPRGPGPSFGLAFCASAIRSTSRLMVCSRSCSIGSSAAFRLTRGRSISVLTPVAQSTFVLVGFASKYRSKPSRSASILACRFAWSSAAVVFPARRYSGLDASPDLSRGWMSWGCLSAGNALLTCFSWCWRHQGTQVQGGHSRGEQ